MQTDQLEQMRASLDAITEPARHRRRSASTWEDDAGVQKAKLALDQVGNVRSVLK